MIDYETLLVRAYQMGLEKDPDVVRSYYNLLIGKLKKRELDPRLENIKVTEPEILSHYERHRDRFTRPARIRLAFLMMGMHPTMSEEKKRKIRERMAEARDKALKTSNSHGFGSLAIDYSEHQATRYKGGDIGWIEEGRRYRWDPEIIEAGFSLKKRGAISDTIETDTGLYLVKVMDRRASEIIPLEKVKERIRHQLVLSKQKEQEKAFQDEIKNAVPIQIYHDALASVPDLTPQDAASKEVAPPPIQ
jgi:hypothetical protein